MKGSPILKLLVGGDFRGKAKSDEAAQLVLENPSLSKSLIAEMWNADPLIRMRAADAVEKCSRENPRLLRPYKKRLLELARETQQQELQWHLAQFIPRLPLTQAERTRAARIMRGYFESKSSIVRTCTLQALFDLAREHSTMLPEVVQLLRERSRFGSLAEKARARKLLSSIAHDCLEKK